MFTIDQLQAFVATAETGSFSAAGRKIGRAQSVISQHIMNMEVDCGVELFERSGRYPTLTKAGLELVPYAKATLSQLERLTQRATHLHSEPSNELILAIDEGIPLTGLTEVLHQLDQDFPYLKLECLTASSPDVIQLVADGRATTGIVFADMQLPSMIDASNLGHLPMNIYVGQQHPLAQQKIRHMGELKAYRQLLIRSKHNPSSAINQAFSPEIWYADNYYILLELADRGFGWCFLPDHLVAHSANQLVRLDDASTSMSWQVNIDLIQHQNWLNDPLHQQSKQALQQLFAHG